MLLTRSSPSTTDASLEDTLDALLAGDTSLAQARNDAIGDKLLRLARANAAEADRELRRWVAMSITVNGSVRQVAEMVRQIREADSRTQSIAAAADETSRTIDGITSTADAVANDAREATHNAQQGHVAAVEAVDVMEGIASSVRDAVAKVETLGEASTMIGQIVQDIDAIAKQTNLLAINASVEAARAGDAGKGFAVVAGEVKNLAGQTARATNDIRSRIATLREEMSRIVDAMTESANRVEKGRSVIKSTGENIGRLGGQVDAVTTKMADIANLLHQQKQATSEIAEGAGVVIRMNDANISSIDAAIQTLERSEAPIVEGINELVQKAPPGATIQAAKSDHMIWMRKLSQMLAGRARLDPNELADHHGCRLGKWYDQQTDRALLSHPAWRALLEPHRQVHRAGIDAARAYKAGNLERSIAFVNEAGVASEQVMSLLDQLGGTVHNPS
ncbi:MAG: methyl-accepting chemotaxis protein [Geminicoccaceae bacterium]